MTIIYSDCGAGDDYHRTYVARHLSCNHIHDGTLCEVCNEMAKVESQIEDLHSRLKELHEKHRILRTKRNDISNIISKLPYDIASYIFTLCLPPIEHKFHPDCDPICPDFPTLELPLKLAAVCHSWRLLAHSIPPLWSTLSIDACNTNLQYLTRYLQWSGSTPLRVQLWADPDPTFLPPNALDVLSLVKQNFHRIALLCLRLPCQFVKNFQGIDTPNNLPILEELHFHCIERSGASPCMEPHNFSFSTDPPYPHKVFVDASSISSMRLKWDNIRHLILRDPVTSTAFVEIPSLLSQGTRLQVVDLFSFYHLVPLTGMTITQNSIRNLRLFYTLINTLSHVTMPHLESLTLWETNGDSGNPIISFLQRSACPLKTMVWKTSRTPPVFIDVFRFTPRLQKLTLNFNYFSGSEGLITSFLERLADKDPSRGSKLSIQPFLPLLQKFVYVKPTAPTLILDMAEARNGTFLRSERGQVQPLEEVIIYANPDGAFEPPTGTDLQRILRLKAVGTKVSVLKYEEECEMMSCDFSPYYDND